VRFIAATNKDLHALIQKNQFREDLFYRLNVATIQVPPLRKHKEDIPLLAEYFLSEYSRMHSTSAKSISDPVMTMLVQHDWPGNVRELKNTINYAATVSMHEVLSIADLPPHFQHLSPQPVPTTNIREDMERQLILDMLQKTNYNKKKTAEILNMSRNTLYNKLEKYGIMTPK
jgi:DNA-binding NtrC family response regulator